MKENVLLCAGLLLSGVSDVPRVFKMGIKDLENIQKQHYSPQNRENGSKSLKIVHFRVGAVLESGTRNHAGAFFCITRSKLYTTYD